MRSVSSLCSIVFVVTCVVGINADEPHAKKDVLAKLQGHWKADKLVYCGKEISEGKDKSYRIDKRKLVAISDGKDVGIFRIKIDTASEPFKLELTIVGGPRDGQTGLAIFKFDKDRFVSCFSYPGDPRPTSFESTAANRYFLRIDRKVVEE